ncbi:uncharacterized protein [Solanum tuberosum]|uniref:uncharacterized protein isoform X2 n=1 Tax=Solanum tuberosum TaxID=4113 RepID=UPI0003D27978|nr:PREDICTED: uncharacterized protein LOC102593847 isoform X2 [Solanum tuberosum]
MGSDTHGIVRTLGKGASPSLVYGPVYKRSQAEKRYFDSRVEMEVQKATSAKKIEMTEKMYEAKKEMEAMDKKLLEAKEETKENKEVMERTLSEAKMDMEEIIEDKVKEGIQAYVESLGINIDANLKSEFLITHLKIVNNHHHLFQVFTQERAFKEIEVKYRLHEHARLLD